MVDLANVPADDEESGDSAAVHVDGVEVAQNYADIKATEFMKEEDRQAVKGTAAEDQELQDFLAPGAGLQGCFFPHSKSHISI